MILILGKGVLASALNSKIANSVLVGRPEYDFMLQDDCDRLVHDYHPSVVINAVGVNRDKDPWTILTTNYTSAVYLTLQFYNKMPSGQIINISSASAIWPSYPGIDTQRFCYNISKENLSNFSRHFNRKIVDEPKNVTVSTVELGRFSSPMNNYDTGLDMDRVVNCIQSIMSLRAQQITIIP